MNNNQNTTVNTDVNQNLNATNNSSSTAKGIDSNLFLVTNLLTGNENFMQWKFSIQLAPGAKKKSGFINAK